MKCQTKSSDDDQKCNSSDKKITNQNDKITMNNNKVEICTKDITHKILKNFEMERDTMRKDNTDNNEKQINNNGGDGGSNNQIEENPNNCISEEELNQMNLDSITLIQNSDDDILAPPSPMPNNTKFQMATKISINPLEDPIIQEMFQQRNVKMDTVEEERRKRMYIMMKQSKKYKRIQAERANQKWNQMIEEDDSRSNTLRVEELNSTNNDIDNKEQESEETDVKSDDKVEKNVYKKKREKINEKIQVINLEKDMLNYHYKTNSKVSVTFSENQDYCLDECCNRSDKNSKIMEEKEVHSEEDSEYIIHHKYSELDNSNGFGLTDLDKLDLDIDNIDINTKTRNKKKENNMTRSISVKHNKINTNSRKSNHLRLLHQHYFKKHENNSLEMCKADADLLISSNKICNESNTNLVNNSNNNNNKYTCCHFYSIPNFESGNECVNDKFLSSRSLNHISTSNPTDSTILYSTTYSQSEESDEGSETYSHQQKNTNHLKKKEEDEDEVVTKKKEKKKSRFSLRMVYINRNNKNDKDKSNSSSCCSKQSKNDLNHIKNKKRGRIRFFGRSSSLSQKSDSIKIYENENTSHDDLTLSNSCSIAEGNNLSTSLLSMESDISNKKKKKKIFGSNKKKVSFYQYE